MSDATVIDAAWANQVQEEIMALVDLGIRRADVEYLMTSKGFDLQAALRVLTTPPRLTPDLPDVPLHQRGFGVLDDRNE